MEKLKIITQKKNPLFNREELQLVVKADVSPKTSEAAEFVAKEFGGVAENVMVRKIKGNFGSNEFLITANIYSSKEDRDKIETRTKKPKKAAGGAKK
jgi:ribosomal protein S24E